MTTEIIPAKAITDAEQSDSIVVSFGAEWHQPLLSKAFSVVIRKRIPKSSSPKWLYFHINNPVSALCGRAKIQQLSSITEEEAIVLADQIHLSPAEIKSYIGTATNIGCYKLGTFEIWEPIPVAKLGTRLAYYPPQSFFILSKQAKQVVDHFSGFTPLKGKSSK
jgi:hypothetical protein